MLVYFNVRGQQEMDLFTGGSVIMTHIFAFLKLKRLNHGFFFLMYMQQKCMWCGLWCFYQPFALSFWRHPFTAEYLLVSKWSNSKLLQICYDEEINSSVIGWLQGEWANFHVSMNYFFKIGLNIPAALLYCNWVCHQFYLLQVSRILKGQTAVSWDSIAFYWWLFVISTEHFVDKCYFWME